MDYIACRNHIHRKDGIGSAGLSFGKLCFRGSHVQVKNSRERVSAEWLDEGPVEVHDTYLLRGLCPSRDHLYCLIQTCIKRKAWGIGRQLYTLMVSTELDMVPVLADRLILLCALSGSLLEANLVFCKVMKPSAHTWHAIISAHTRLGCNQRALHLYCQMQDMGVMPNKTTLLCILKASSSIEALQESMAVHTDIILCAFENDLVIGNTLIDVYAKCGALEEAHKVFKSLLASDVVSWNAMISGYARNGHKYLALDLYQQMQEEGVSPDKVTYASILNACGTLGTLEQGVLLHDHIIESGLEVDIVVGNTLIDMYAKWGSVEEARYIFDNLVERDLLSWSALLAGYTEYGEGARALYLFADMQQQEFFVPDIVIFLSLIKACGSQGAVVQGMLIHDQIISNRFETEVVIGSTLVDMYGKCGIMKEAQKVFDTLQNRNLVSWNALLSGYAQHGCDKQVLELFGKMQVHDIWPDHVTFLYVLRSSRNIGAISLGKLLHDQVITLSLESDLMVGCTLIDMYVKFGNLKEACKVFEKCPIKSPYLWNAIIAGHAQNGQNLAAFQHLQKMRHEGVQPDEVTWSCVVKSCTATGAIGEGKHMHDEMLKAGVELDIVLANSLIDMYAKSGSLEAALQVFEEMPSRNISSWNTVIAGHVFFELGFPAIELYEKLHAEGLIPDRSTYLSTLKACTIIGAIKQGKLIHDQIVRGGLERDIAIGSAIIDMYAKCGNLGCATNTFYRMQNHNVVSWGAMIAGFALHGHCAMAERSMGCMQEQGWKPDGRVFTSILAACSHAGLVGKGYAYFKSLREEQGIIPSAEHLNCMIDLLGRSGRLFEAKGLLQSLPGPPDVSGWMSLFTACRIYGDKELAKQCFDGVVQLYPGMAGGYVAMSNIYADAQMWDEIPAVQSQKNHAGASKKPGKAWIEMNSKAYEFVVQHKSCLGSSIMAGKLEGLARRLKVEGYAPDVNLVLEQVTSGEKGGNTSEHVQGRPRIIPDKLWARAINQPPPSHSSGSFGYPPQGSVQCP